MGNMSFFVLIAHSCVYILMEEKEGSTEDTEVQKPGKV